MIFYLVNKLLYLIYCILCFRADDSYHCESVMADAFPVICIKPEEDAADYHTGVSQGKIAVYMCGIYSQIL